MHIKELSAASKEGSQGHSGPVLDEHEMFVMEGELGWRIHSHSYHQEPDNLEARH